MALRMVSRSSSWAMSRRPRRSSPMNLSGAYPVRPRTPSLTKLTARAGVGDASDDGFPVGEAGQVVEQGQQLAAVLVQLLADFGVVAFELLAHLLVHDVRTHACQHLGVMERLGDVVDAADLEPPRFLAGIVHVGNEDHGDVAQPGIPFDMLADGIAVHIRHHDVEQYQIRDLFTHVFQCFCPAFGDAEPVFPVQLADRVSAGWWDHRPRRGQGAFRIPFP